MNLESLVKEAKHGNSVATAEILESFKPFILKTCKTIYINGYEMEDLIQIGNISLLKAISKYNIDQNNKFTAYAISAIKNNYYYEIRKRCKLNSECSLNFEIGDGIELIENIYSEENIEEDFLNREVNSILINALNTLDEEDKKLIIEIYFKQTKLIDYAKINNINYISLSKRKSKILKKLKNIIKTEI